MANLLVSQRLAAARKGDETPLTMMQSHSYSGQDGHSHPMCHCSVAQDVAGEKPTCMVAAYTNVVTAERHYGV